MSAGIWLDHIWWKMEVKNYLCPGDERNLAVQGRSVVPILQSICQWADIFYKNEGEIEMTQCQRCDYRS